MFRVLKPSGTVLTQQVEGDNWPELRRFFPRKTNYGDHFTRYRAGFEALGMRIVQAQLADRVNLLFCGGMMSAATHSSILNALMQVSSGDPLQRVQLAVFLAAACPEGAIQR